MTNPYDIHEAAEAPQPVQPVDVRADIVRPLLWGVLVVSAAANMVTSSAGLNVLFGVGFGLVTLACITGLVVDHYTHRTR